MLIIHGTSRKMVKRVGTLLTKSPESAQIKQPKKKKKHVIRQTKVWNEWVKHKQKPRHAQQNWKTKVED